MALDVHEGPGRVLANYYPSPRDPSPPQFHSGEWHAHARAQTSIMRDCLLTELSLLLIRGCRIWGLWCHNIHCQYTKGLRTKSCYIAPINWLRRINWAADFTWLLDVGRHVNKITDSTYKFSFILPIAIFFFFLRFYIYLITIQHLRV